ncbi:glutamate receptor ionotropic, kainate 2-like [Paramacrobiotus metropolitanus]|uniref:glutamate receptor ionotropic, kainate 2-like n=1 Tax=Paramacrobiotus metropolitanus TaxID=2943436 RepID=UPI0024462112|nr:glutamate receptor ionotropic, kainate 2-like [Paramacrobiotus metropolitanus]
MKEKIFMKRSSVLLVALYWSAVCRVFALPDSLTVVGLFNDPLSDLKYVFDYAISSVNEDSDLRISGTRLDGKKHDIPPFDSFRASKQVCRILHEQVLAVMGPQNPFSSDNVQSIAESLSIPHIEARWDYRIWSPNESFSTNVYPDYRVLSRAFSDIVKLWQWPSFTILYETNEGIIKLQELLRGATKMKVSLRLLKGPDYHDVLKDVRASGESRIILDCHVSKVPDILHQAQQLKLTSPYYQYLLTTLDLHTIDLSTFVHDHPNITAFRLVNPRAKNVQTAVRGWTAHRITPGSVGTVPSNLVVTTDQALFYDSMLLLAKALTRPEVADLATVPVNCDNEQAWSRGRDFVNALAATQVKGLSGMIKFNENRSRTDFKLDIVQLLSRGYQEVGRWNPRDGAVITWNYTDHYAQISSSMRNKTLRAITIREDPYVMWKSDHETRVGTDKYEVTAYVIVSLTIFVLARFSPYEWYNPHPCNEEGDVVENQFTICNSLWFTIGSLMQQGSDIAPRAVSTRVAAGCWWFFTLIMISSYTANLAAFLTVERMKLPIESADDLSKQNLIRYGCYHGGATYNFFKDSKLPVYKRMWDAMSADPSNFVKKGAAGVARVKNDKYAYLMESPSLEYEMSKDCDLTQIGNLLDSKGFGIATPQNSPYRDEISKAILKLQENSVLHKLKENWWKKNNSSSCDSISKPQDQASELGLANVGGVFVILIAGLILSFAVAILEFVWKARKTSMHYRDPIGTEMSRALCFAVRLHGSSKKPVVRPSHETLENPNNYDLSRSTSVPLSKGKYLM